MLGGHWQAWRKTLDFRHAPTHAEDRRNRRVSEGRRRRGFPPRPLVGPWRTIFPVPRSDPNYLCRQLDLPPVLFVNPPQREATDLEHERLIRDYLGFRPFDRTDQDRLERLPPWPSN